jgi:hypothetical protein
MSMTPLSEAERMAILDAEVERFIAQGYRLVARTPTTVQLVRPKHFSAGLAILAFLFFVIGLVIYLLLYLSDRDETAYLTVDEFGRLDGVFDPPRSRRNERYDERKKDWWECLDCGRKNHPTRRGACKFCRAARPVDA